MFNKTVFGFYLSLPPILFRTRLFALFCGHYCFCFRLVADFFVFFCLFAPRFPPTSKSHFPANLPEDARKLPVTYSC